MRIAQVANFVGPTSGGVKTVLDALGRGYVAAGHERLLVVPGPVDAVEESAAGTVVRLRAPQVGGGYRLVVDPWRITAALEEFGPTSVELSDKWSLFPVARWARRRGTPSVLLSHERLDAMLTLRTGAGAGLGTGIESSVRVLDRRLARAVDTIVVTSGFARAEFEPAALRAGTPLVTVPLGVDLETFAPASAPPGRGRDDVVRLVHVGRLSREKSPHLAVATAVELWRRGLPLRLDVYGAGPHRHELVAIAGDAPVHLHGHVGDRRLVARALAGADLALSVCPGETFGLAVLEALASGTPVLTCDRGGARELVDAGSGAWGEPTPAALADAATTLLARPRAEREAGARRRATAYPWSATVRSMLAVHAQPGRRLSGTVTA